MLKADPVIQTIFIVILADSRMAKDIDRLMLQAWRPILLLVTLILGMNIGGSEVSQMIILTRLPEMSSFINLATIGIPSCLNS